MGRIHYIGPLTTINIVNTNAAYPLLRVSKNSASTISFKEDGDIEIVGETVSTDPDAVEVI